MTLLRVLAPCVALLAAPLPCSAGTPARADRGDVARRVVVGAPAGAAAMSRIDARRSGRSDARLPAWPTVALRTRLPASPGGPPAIDAEGRLVVPIDDARLVQLDGAGRVQWVRAMSATASAGVVLASDGTRVAPTDDGAVVGVTATGEPAFTTRLPDAGLPTRVAPLALEDGTVVVATGSTAVRVGRSGEVESTTRVDGNILALLRCGEALRLVTESGGVFSWPRAQTTLPSGTLGGRPGGEVVCTSTRTVAAIVNDARLVELDLVSGRRRTLAQAGADSFLGEPALAPGARGAELRVVTRSGWLLGFTGTEETTRVAIAPPPAVPVGPPAVATSPVVDAAGSTAVLSASSIHVALAGGDVRALAVPGCSATVALVPSAAGRWVVLCKDGLVAWIEDGRPPAPDAAGAPPPAGPARPTSPP